MSSSKEMMKRAKAMKNFKKAEDALKSNKSLSISIKVNGASPCHHKWIVSDATALPVVQPGNATSAIDSQLGTNGLLSNALTKEQENFVHATSYTGQAFANGIVEYNKNKSLGFTASLFKQYADKMMPGVAKIELTITSIKSFLGGSDEFMVGWTATDSVVAYDANDKVLFKFSTAMIK